MKKLKSILTGLALLFCTIFVLVGLTMLMWTMPVALAVPATLTAICAVLYFAVVTFEKVR